MSQRSNKQQASKQQTSRQQTSRQPVSKQPALGRPASTAPAQTDRVHVEHEDEHEEHGPSLRTYWLVFAALMVLLVATVGAAEIPFGFAPLSIAVALTIAVVKAVLIILFFMHVRYSSRLIWVYSTAAFFWLVIMLGFTFTDYLTRTWVPIGGR